MRPARYRIQEDPFTGAAEPAMATKISTLTNSRRNLVSIILFVLGVSILAGTGGWLLYSYFNDDSYADELRNVEGFGPGLEYFQQPATATPPPGNESPVARLRIPKYDVDAPVIVLGVDENGVMESPEGPWDVAWYDFTTKPGKEVGNAVFSGHVDWTFDSGPAGAVFWHLKDMVNGDVVEVVLEDGTVYKYSVISKELVDPDTADVGAIVGPTERDIVTLITCGGTFNYATGHYENRTIVRAERITDAPAEAGGPASANTAP